MHDFRSAVSDRVFAALDESAPFIDDERTRAIWAEFLRPVRELAQSGKRTRALLLAAGYEAYGGPGKPVHAGAALELYQLSALAHDDIIDESHTRRGVPAIHRGFAASHRAHSMHGNSADFGVKAGILAGDFLLSLGAVEIERAEHASGAGLARGRELFHLMTAETAYGQYLDLRAELTALNSDEASAIRESLLVLRHKSARYSVELPLMIGGALAGGDDDALRLLSEVGRPLGIAFQLRDDELGIFGNSDDTGKPAGGDIAEGKRTVLLALTRARAAASDVAFIDSALGRDITATEVDRIRQIIDASGANAAHEAIIAEQEERAREAAAELPATPILASVMAQLARRRH